MTVALIASGISLLLVVFLTGMLVYTNQYIAYLEEHPVVQPPTASDYQPDGGFLGCHILNHTYFNSSGNALIDIYATVHANNTYSNCPNNKKIRFYGDILQSCRCHNASQVNKTIDEEFPLNQTITCCINNGCTLFNNVCSPHPGFTYPSPDIPTQKFLFGMLVFLLICATISFCGFFGHIVLDKMRKKGYEALKK